MGDPERRNARSIRRAISIAELDKRGKRKRDIKTFDRKKEADAFHAQVRVDLGKGIHVPASEIPTIEQAGRNWIDSCADLERTTRDGYEQHLRDHINPYLGGLKLSVLTVAIVRDWQDKLRKGVPAPGQEAAEPRSADMVKRVTGSLGSLLADAQERGHVGQNVVRSLKANRKRGKDRKAERRAKGRLKIGADIPAPHEIDAILKAAKGAGRRSCWWQYGVDFALRNCAAFAGKTSTSKRANCTFTSGRTPTTKSVRLNRKPANGRCRCRRRP